MLSSLVSPCDIFSVLSLNCYRVVAVKNKTKSCTNCGESKPLSEFSQYPSRPGYIYARCKVCERKSVKERKAKWKKDNPEAFRNSLRRDNLKRSYGITFEDYDVLLKKQKGGCAICGIPPGKRNLSIDHCHKSLEIRGLLCHRCNRGISFFGDRPELMTSASRYLRKKGTGKFTPR